MKYLFLIPLLFSSAYSQKESKNYGVKEADTAWMIVASCLVMIMTPGLAFFYGGLVRQKSFVSILGQCFIIYSIVTVLWAFIGYSLSFGDSKSNFLGGLNLFSLRNVNYEPNEYCPTIPALLFYFYQNKVATITPCLFIGATAERVRFRSIVILCALWTIVVYCPIAHWNWNLNGFLHKLGIHDFAGGNVVHLSAGSAALVAAIFTDLVSYRKAILKIKKGDNGLSSSHRRSFTKHGRQLAEEDEIQQQIIAKESTAFVVLGTAILWFGWFGFNGGSALAANSQCILALINTNLAAASALLAWYFLELLSGKKSSVIGMCIGAVCGLVGITPACGFVPIYAAGIIGGLSSIGTFCFYTFLEKCHYKPGDKLGVFGCHGISGIIGSILVGFFADKDLGALSDGIFQSGGGYLLAIQLAGICCSFLWSFVVTFILLAFLYLCGLYQIMDEESETEAEDFDEQPVVFKHDIEKMMVIYGSIKNREVEVERKSMKNYELAVLSDNKEKAGTSVQVVFDEKTDQDGRKLFN